MNRLPLAILIVSAGLLFSLPAAADQADGGDAPQEVTPDEAAQLQQERRLFDDQHRREMYETSRLQRRRAVLYSLALPGLGNFYAEQYALGTIALMSLTFSGIFIGYGLVNNQSQIFRLGLATTAFTYAGAATSSYLGVKQYNARLRRNLHLDSTWQAQPLTNERTWTVGWTWRF